MVEKNIQQAQAEVSKGLVLRKPSEGLLALSNQVAEVIGFNPVSDVFVIGNRVNAVAQLLAHPEMDAILEKLEGSPAGFLTDKKDGKYSPIIRAQAMQDCLSQGAKPVGNEINIIKGRGMLVKNFYHRMIDELGHDNSVSSACIYSMMNWYHKEVVGPRGQGTIAFECSIGGNWVNKATGQQETINWSTTITVKFGGEYDTFDKAQGQAQRRAWKEFYERYSGQYTEDINIPDDNAVQGLTMPSVQEGAIKEKPAPTNVMDALEVKAEPVQTKADTGANQMLTPAPKNTPPQPAKPNPPKAAPAEQTKAKTETPQTQPQSAVQFASQGASQAAAKATSQTSMLGPEEGDLF